VFVKGGKIMKHVFFSLLALLLALILSFGFATNLKADIISIDFEDLSLGVSVDSQYSSSGIIFNDGSSSPAGTVDSVWSDGSSTQALRASSINPGIYVFFTIPVYSVSTFVIEGPPPEYEDPPQGGDEPNSDPDSSVPEPESEAPIFVPETDEMSNTVYLYAYEFDGDSYNLLNDATSFVHAEGSWGEVSFSSPVRIAAVQFVGTQDFWLDDIVISTEPEPVPEPVPEPATMLLLGIGLSGLVCVTNRFKKK
jgi:hypothetical protein